jgi:hypothetical protein
MGDIFYTDILSVCNYFNTLILKGFKVILKG